MYKLQLLYVVRIIPMYKPFFKTIWKGVHTTRSFMGLTITIGKLTETSPGIILPNCKAWLSEYRSLDIYDV